MQFIVLAAAVTRGLGSSATHLDSARTWMAYSGVAADLDAGWNYGDTLRLGIEAGAGGLYPVPASADWKRARIACVATIDGMRAFVWIVNVGEGEDGRHSKAG